MKILCGWGGGGEIGEDDPRINRFAKRFGFLAAFFFFLISFIFKGKVVNKNLPVQFEKQDSRPFRVKSPLALNHRPILLWGF